MAISTWSTTDLCLDKDLVAIEQNVLKWCAPDGSAERWRAEAKRRIGEKLRRGLHAEQKAATESEVLNLIENPEALLTAACFLTLHLIANDKMTHPQDYYAAKSVFYLGEFNSEWPGAKSDLNYDTDESGTISDSEKFNVRTGVEIERGA